MKLIYMGTPEFSVPALTALSNSRHEILAVDTQPDREPGRGRKIVYPPVKTAALSLGIPVFQPEKLTQEVREEMRAFEADCIIVAAYGKILRKSILEMTPCGCLNIHASLLPKYRGASPIQHAIMDGETESGVTIMQMDEGIDTGDILLQEKVVLDPEETGDSLTGKLADLGGPMILKTLDLLEEGLLKPVPQPPESPTAYSAMLTRETSDLDFTKPSDELSRLIYAMAEKPGCTCRLNGKLLKIYRAEVSSDDPLGLPGTIISVSKTDFTVLTGRGSLKITELQPEGKKRMDCAAYLRGAQIKTGDQLTSAWPEAEAGN